MGKINYFIIKFIAAVFFLYGGWSIFVSVYAINAFEQSFGSAVIESTQQISNIVGYSGFIGLVGLVCLISGLSLLFSKKWGFYLTLISVVLLWGLSWMRVGGLVNDWPILLIASIFFIYLIIARKSILKP